MSITSVRNDAKPAVKTQPRYITECLDLLKKWDPGTACGNGLDGCAGKMFIRSEENIDAALKDIRELRGKLQEDGVKDPLAVRFLDSFEFQLLHIEPFAPLGEASGLLLFSLTKEGDSPELKQHVTGYLHDLRENLREMRKKFSGQKLPVEIRIVTYELANEVLGFFPAIKQAVKNDPEMCKELETARHAIAQFRLDISGLKFAKYKYGGYEKWMPLLKKKSTGDVGRKGWYEDNLKLNWCYPYSAKQIKRLAEDAMKKELPVLKDACRRLAEAYGLDPEKATPAKLLKAARKKSKLKPEEFIPFTKELVKVLYPLIEERITGVAPGHKPEILETPSYLRASLPIAAAFSYDHLAEHPRAITFMTPQAGECPCVFEVLFIISHEGAHDIHHANASVDLAKSGSTPLARLSASGYSGVLTEGVAHMRESELMGLVSDILSKDESLLTASEKKLKDYLAQYADLGQLKAECDFYVSYQKIVRHIRAIADPSMNLNMKSYPQLVKEYVQITGIPPEKIFAWTWNVIVPRPSYGPSYFIAKSVIAKLQEAAKEKGISVKEVNTYISSVGPIPLELMAHQVEEHFGIKTDIFIKAAAQS